jgi:hypothetical protein
VIVAAIIGGRSNADVSNFRNRSGPMNKIKRLVRNWRYVIEYIEKKRGPNTDM